MMEIYFVVGDIAAHDGWVAPQDQDDPSWTYQSITGAHGTILGEYADQTSADAALAAWLECDAAARGEYCYTHNPIR